MLIAPQPRGLTRPSSQPYAFHALLHTLAFSLHGTCHQVNLPCLSICFLVSWLPLEKFSTQGAGIGSVLPTARILGA